MMQVIVSNFTYLEGTLPPETEHYLRKRLTFLNPEYENAERHGRWSGNIPKELKYITSTASGFRIPRGFTAQLIEILNYNGIEHSLVDNTRLLPEVGFQFSGHLYPFQERAVSATLARRFGVLNSPTGSGKTVMALYIIAMRRQPTLIVCHTKELLYQWRDRAMEFLNLQKEEIGIIGDGQHSIGKRLTIAIINSLYKYAPGIQDKFGFLCVDECHRIPGRTFTDAVSHFDCRYMIGLSATAYRRDGLTKVIYFFMGDRVCDIKPDELQRLNKIMIALLIPRYTGYTSEVDASEEYQTLITELTEDTARNQMIISDVLKEAKEEKGICLVLSDRKSHCEHLFERLMQKGLSVRLLTGSVSKKKREEVVRDLELGLVKILVATGSLIGEGFDCKKLSSLFMTTPVKFTGRVTQYLGRILRTAEGKEQPKVYDYVDQPGVLQNSFRSRCRAYEKMGVVLHNL